jgi:hypothetical protein
MGAYVVLNLFMLLGWLQMGLFLCSHVCKCKFFMSLSQYLPPTPKRTALATSRRRRYRDHSHRDPPDVHKKLPFSAGED